MTYRAILNFSAIITKDSSGYEVIVGLVNGIRIDEHRLSEICVGTKYKFEKYTLNTSVKFRQLFDLGATNDMQVFLFISTKLRDKFVSEVNKTIDNINKMKGSFGGI